MCSPVRLVFFPRGDWVWPKGGVSFSYSVERASKIPHDTMNRHFGTAVCGSTRTGVRLNNMNERVPTPPPFRLTGMHSRRCHFRPFCLGAAGRTRDKTWRCDHVLSLKSKIPPLIPKHFPVRATLFQATSSRPLRNTQPRSHGSNNELPLGETAVW